ncbi:MAG: hypothetical protein WDO71_09945 [Bacteroidota bacterium]
MVWQELLQQIQQGDAKALARSISLIENEYEGYESLLQSPVLRIGVTLT